MSILVVAFFNNKGGVGKTSLVVVIPVAPNLFSVQGLRNLGPICDQCR